MREQLLFKLGLQKRSRCATKKFTVTPATTRFTCTTRKVYVQLMKKFCNDMKTKVSGCFRLIAKKSLGRFIVVAALVLPLGLDKFGHVLDVDLPRKRSSLVDRFINEIFASWKFLGFVAESISNHLATMVYACVSDQQFFRATKFQKKFCIPGLNLYRFFRSSATK